MVFINEVNNYMFRPKAAIFRLSQLELLPPPQIHTPPFIDPLDIPVDELTCNM